MTKAQKTLKDFRNARIFGLVRRHPLLALLTTFLFIAIRLSQLLPERFIVLNLSPSLPPRLYVRIDAKPTVGSLVEFRIAQNRLGGRAANTERFILKPIAAGSGQHVDTTGDWLHIDGRRLAPMVTTDSNGNPVDVWRANRTLSEEEYFVYSDRVLRSYDSRIFGPLRAQDIATVRVPLWTWLTGRHTMITDTVPQQAGEQLNP